MSSELVGRQVGSYRIDAPLSGAPPRLRFRGTHVATGRIMELVVLALSSGQEAELSELLYPQIRAVGEQQSPRILPVEDVFVQDGLLVLVHPPTSGPTLEERLESGPLPLAEVIAFASGALEGLTVAHEAGVVHGALGPSTVVLEPRGVRLQGFSEVNLQVSPATFAEGVPLATAEILAPERWAGGAPDTRSDVYSLGLCVWAALVGRLHAPTRSGDAVAWSRLHTRSDVPDVRDRRPDTPSWLANLIWRATRRDPRARFADAREMRWHLDNHVEAEDDDLEVSLEVDPGTDELLLPDPEAAPVDPGALDGGGVIQPPLPPEENEWAFDQPTAVGDFAELTDPQLGASPPPDDEWELDQPTAVGVMPQHEAARAAAPPAPPRDLEPTAPPPLPKRRRGGGFLGALSGCGLVGVAGVMGLCILLCAVGYEQGWHVPMLESLQGSSAEPVTIEQPEVVEEIEEVAEDPEAEAVAEAEDSGDPAAAEEEVAEEVEEEAEEEVAPAGSSSGSSSSSGRSSGSSSGSSGSSSRSSGSSGSSGSSSPRDPEPVDSTEPASGGSDIEVVDEGDKPVRLVIMLTARKRKEMKGAVVVLDEETLGAPPQSVDVSVGTHMVEWRGDGWRHICPVEVPKGGKTVKMDLDDGECPW